MHAMTATEVFLLAILIIFTAPYLVWRLGRTDYWAPLVVVQIIGGVLLGPGVLGALFPSYYAFVFTPATIGSLNGIAWWAVMIFVWIAGIELDLDELHLLAADPEVDVIGRSWRAGAATEDAGN